jgi:hypothetical protein
VNENLSFEVKEPCQRIVGEGRWRYSGAVEKPVYVIEQNYDYWFEMEKADGKLATDEKPDLNWDGLLYYISFQPPEGAPPWSVDSVGCKTIAEAKAWAVEKASGPIRWR